MPSTDMPLQPHWGWRHEQGEFVFSCSTQPSWVSVEELRAHNTQIIYAAINVSRQTCGNFDYSVQLKTCPYTNRDAIIREYYAECSHGRYFFLVYLCGDELFDYEFTQMMHEVHKAIPPSSL